MKGKGPAARRRASRRLVLWSLVNACLLAAVWVCGAWVAERTWLTTLIAYSPQWPYGLPLLALLVVSAARRRWRALALNVAVVLAFAFGPLGVCLPLSRAAPGGRTVRVMTWNIHGGRDGVAGILEAVRAEDPDVLCMQEADPHRGKGPLPAGLAEGLAGYRIEVRGEVAIASRLPIVGVALRPLSQLASYRPMLEVRVQAGERVITVQTVHFASAAPGRSLLHRGSGIPEYVRQASAVRQGQADAVVALDRSAEGPVILCGDLNTPPRGRVYGALRSRFRDSFSDAGWGTGYTYSAAWPMLRIDYVFTGGGARAMRAYVPAVHASDHRPVVAEVVMGAGKG